MNGRFISATLTGAIVSFLAGWVIFGLLFNNFYITHSVQYIGLYRNPPNLVALFVAQLSYAFLLTYIFQKWANITSFVPGAMAGIIITLPIIVSYDISTWAMMNLWGKEVVFADVILNCLMGALVGGFIAWVLGFRKTA